MKENPLQRFTPQSDKESLCVGFFFLFVFTHFKYSDIYLEVHAEYEAFNSEVFTGLVLFLCVPIQ